MITFLAMVAAAGALYWGSRSWRNVALDLRGDDWLGESNQRPPRWIDNELYRGLGAVSADWRLNHQRENR